jgi:hypothetical protein
MTRVFSPNISRATAAPVTRGDGAIAGKPPPRPRAPNNNPVHATSRGDQGRVRVSNFTRENGGHKAVGGPGGFTTELSAPVRNRRRPVPVLDPTVTRTPVLHPRERLKPLTSPGSALESRNDGEVTPRRKNSLAQQREPTVNTEGDGVPAR